MNERNDGRWLSDATKYPDMVSAALVREVIEAIEATGGVYQFESGHFAPVADPEWIDMGEAYVSICNALGREPKTTPAP